MDPRVNPYAPGAGTPPPELAGRDAVLADARLAIERNKSGRSARSFLFVGLRGVGKTLLLNEVQAMAEEEGALTDFIEVANNEPLSITVIATLRSILLKLDGDTRPGTRRRSLPSPGKTSRDRAKRR